MMTNTIINIVYIPTDSVSSHGNFATKFDSYEEFDEKWADVTSDIGYNH